MGFTVNSPKNIYDVLSITQGFGIMITSSTNITYELTFTKYSGKAIMKAKDKEVPFEETLCGPGSALRQVLELFKAGPYLQRL